jgi:hypothetical protein
LDENTARAWFKKFKSAHVPECIYKINAKMPSEEFGAKVFDGESLLILSRKLVLVKWREIFCSILQTYKQSADLPELSHSSVKKLRESFTPGDFENLVTALEQVRCLLQGETKSLKRQNELPILPMLVISGWRYLIKEQCYECPSCLRKVHSSFIKHSPKIYHSMESE